ncbi:MAG TPA: hypothetical protein VHW04_23045 [Solirubrobacteraceae bacterium]|nr:hypothetical protein [Solirubrobacteraceae bacterium]
MIERDREMVVLLIDRRRRAVDRRAVRDRFGDLLELLLAGGREAERDVRSGTVGLAARATYASSPNTWTARPADASRSPVAQQEGDEAREVAPVERRERRTIADPRRAEQVAV